MQSEREDFSSTVEYRQLHGRPKNTQKRRRNSGKKYISATVVCLGLARLLGQGLPVHDIDKAFIP